MKKTTFVLLTAAVLVFAFSATAMADTASGKIPWSATSPGNTGTLATPHKDYTLTTQKCLVCHAVHKANPDGEILLDDTVGNACNYCHVSTNTISTKFVYDKDPANLEDDTAYGHEIAACSSCHSIRGANTIQQPDLASAILRNDLSYTQTGLPADWNTATGSKEGAMSAFCDGCHPYFTDEYALAGDPGNVYDPWKGTGPFNSHIMKDISADADYGNTEAAYSGQVAWVSSNYCTSCHDGGSNTPDDSFPHMTKGARFMKSAEYAGATAIDAASATEDGVCLKCHVGTGGTVGVGIDF